MYAQAVAINPQILDLAIGTGFEMPNDFPQMVFRRVFFYEKGSPEDKVDQLEVRDHFEHTTAVDGLLGDLWTKPPSETDFRLRQERRAS